jgi:hypothetical protein
MRAARDESEVHCLIPRPNLAQTRAYFQYSSGASEVLTGQLLKQLRISAKSTAAPTESDLRLALNPLRQRYLSELLQHNAQPNGSGGLLTVGLQPDAPTITVPGQRRRVGG